MSVEMNQSLANLEIQLEDLLDRVDHMQVGDITEDVRTNVRNLFEKMSQLAITELGQEEGLEYREDLEKRVLKIAPRRERNETPPRRFGQMPFDRRRGEDGKRIGK